MTCIVGWIENDKVYMGADSAGVSGLNLRVRADEKVFVNGEMLFGFTSSFRMGQLLRYELSIPEQPASKDDFKYMCTDFITAVIKCLEKHKFAKVNNNEISGGTFLVGYKGKLYYVDDDFQVGQFALPFASCGCGEAYALGVMYTLHSQKEHFGPRVLELALAAAVEFSAGVRPPFIVKDI